MNVVADIKELVKTTVAAALEGMFPHEKIVFACSVTGNDLNKYLHLDNGRKSMSAGNLLRGHMMRGGVVNGVSTGTPLVKPARKSVRKPKELEVPELAATPEEVEEMLEAAPDAHSEAVDNIADLWTKAIIAKNAPVVEVEEAAPASMVAGAVEYFGAIAIVPWNKANDSYMFWTMNEDGTQKFHKEQPHYEKGEWLSAGSRKSTMKPEIVCFAEVFGADCIVQRPQ